MIKKLFLSYGRKCFVDSSRVSKVFVLHPLPMALTVFSVTGPTMAPSLSQPSAPGNHSQ